MRKFVSAGQAEILRSHQKDESVINKLRENVSIILQNLLGVHGWLKWKTELEIVTDLSYFIFTTLSNLQTFGEEYVHTILVDGTKRRLPSMQRRAVMILLQIAFPYTLKYVINYHQKKEASNPDSSLKRKLFGFSFTTVKWLQILKYFLNLIHRYHIVLFYLKGGPYHLSKRFTGIHYVLIRDWLKVTAIQKIFRVLGIVSLLQLIVENGLALKKCIEENQSVNDSDIVSCTTSQKSKENPLEILCKKCSLCLDLRKNSTCTICGHLFCWECITEWLRTNDRCPLCREEISASRLVYLQNYD